MRSIVSLFWILLLAETCLGQQAEVNQFLDRWHQAAADANSTAFFNAMADSSVYIGTDASERWSKREFMAFAKPYLTKEKPGILKHMIAISTYLQTVAMYGFQNF